MESNSAWTETLNRRTLLARAGRGAGVVAGAGTLAPLIAACGSSSPSSSASSSAAGSGLTLDKVMHATGNVKVLGFSGYQVRQSTPPGMTAKWGYNSTNEQIITKTTQPGSFDLVIITSALLGQLRLLNRIAPIDVSLLPNWTKLDPFFRNTPFIRADGKIWAVPQHWGYNYTQYNADKLAAPTTYQDLLSPNLRHKIGLPDDPYAVITTFAFFAGLSKDANTLTPSQFKTVTNMLEDFRKQVLTIHQYGEENQLFARHDIYVDLPSYSNSFLLTRKAGINAQYTLLGAWSYIDCYWVLAAATNVAGRVQIHQPGDRVARPARVDQEQPGEPCGQRCDHLTTRRDAVQEHRRAPREATGPAGRNRENERALRPIPDVGAVVGTVQVSMTG